MAVVFAADYQSRGEIGYAEFATVRPVAVLLGFARTLYAHAIEPKIELLTKQLTSTTWG
jgi:hypothetical protein